MQIIVLGAAAGGGLPQWNCGCENCRRARAGDPLVVPRTQCGLAVSPDGSRWILLNASPDLRHQISATRALDPPSGRASPISDVVLTSGEIDALLGLLTLRERHRFTIHAASRVLTTIEENPIFRALGAGVVRRQAHSNEPVALATPSASAGLSLSLFPVPGKVPLYMESEATLQTIGAESEDTAGVELRSEPKRAYFIPGCAALSPSLSKRLRGADLLLFDGTMWTDDEMIRLGLGEKTGRRMGHMSIAGPEGSLAAFADLEIKRKIYLHINNTNPVLVEGSPERAAVNAAGWEVAYDGMEIPL